LGHPAVVAGLAGLGAFVVLAHPVASTPSPEAEAPAGFDRRRFLRSALALSAAAAASGVVTRYLEKHLMAEAGRASLKIPPPGSPAKPLAAGAQLNVEGISPFYTPNDRFYRVDTALLVPQVQLKDWKLRIHGMVDHPRHRSHSRISSDGRSSSATSR
jgi:DMSO/TMAO reductase YedYZ molybdopterin-dependent catalytic subunit